MLLHSFPAEGCYVDPNPARLLKKGVPGCDPGNGDLLTLPAGTTCVPAKMTPEYCATMCWAGLQTTAEATGATILVGPEAGAQCFCDTVAICIKIDEFALKMMNSAFRLMNSVLKMMIWMQTARCRSGMA